MKEKLVYIETQNKKYPLSFNLNVMAEIQEQYGTVEAWGNIVENNGVEPKIKDLKAGLVSMINEGIDIENENSEVKQPFVTDKQVGRIVTEIGVIKVIKLIEQITFNSTESEEEPKNE